MVVSAGVQVPQSGQYIPFGLLSSFLVVSLSSYALIFDPGNFAGEAKLSKQGDFGLNIIEFLEKYEYPVECHEVTTEDGYLLTMHRIPHGRNQTNTTTPFVEKPPVLLMHGLFFSSMDWVNTGPNKSLALNLADLGYDVWLGNNRGNTWSRKHLVLDPDLDQKFWDFSFDTCGCFDLPAKIDYILNTTGREKLSYVGFSQGTTAFFALASLKPEYNEKIAVMAALGPVAYMRNLAEPVAQFYSYFMAWFVAVLDLFGVNEIFSNTPLLLRLLEMFCVETSIFQDLCLNVLFFLTGEDLVQFERSFVEVAISNAPAGISLKMLSHYIQGIDSGDFTRYDYGLKNMEVYGQLSPPSYNVSLITTPVALFYAKNDRFSPVRDVEQLANQLPNVVLKNLIEWELFNHIDFVLARDVKTLLNDDVIKLLNVYNFIS
ncbi:hypothetical protein NQ315_007597 [Exocentrus adspersus]|uniref:Lipase n=1 Tax=Exocentrus adspersus TaxID=1586481 RepID=A0AAV8W8V9_9CUCU|nr:hypothetical protein NQ315_007597 [Exocentrus adspersus]